MGCNCSTNREINNIINKFGTRYKDSDSNLKLFDKLSFYFEYYLTILMVIMSIPLIMCYIGYMYMNGTNKISFKEFLSLHNNVVQQSYS